MNISSIYAGKPDATDEIRERGYDEFANNYIRPSGVDIERLASAEYGTPFFIMGDKGTGKTALLYFLENYILTKDPTACSSFVYFESEYNQVQRQKFNALSKSISTSIHIDSSIATEGSASEQEHDFTYIWRWQLYQKIITDNEQFNGGLFENNDIWHKFVLEIEKIDKTISKERMRIPAKVSFATTANPQIGTITPEISVEPIDLSQRSFNLSTSYNQFVHVIDNADNLFYKLSRTSTPYYMFIDELEAYRANGNTFYRDLRMIRDLLFTVKRFNDAFGSGTKIICSVRLEIINAINRFVQTNQLHKIMQGYDERLTWEYTNTNSFNHPIIGILLRRIQNAEEKVCGHCVSTDEIIHKWFTSHVYNTHICTYILDNTWHKPRDIVRLLLSAQSKSSKNLSIFNQNTFETFMPVYSKQCLVEVREEMRALYTAEEIESIFNCLQGFKVVFTYDEIVERAKRLYPESVLSKDPCTVLNDMYRIGVIGNILSNRKSSRWEYKEQYKLYIDSPWEIVIHPSLRIELSVNGRIDKHIGKKRSSPPSIQKKDTTIGSDVYKGVITAIRDRYILLQFEKDGTNQAGYIGIGNLNIPDAEIGELQNYYSIGDIVNIEIAGYNTAFSNWYVRIVSEN